MGLRIESGFRSEMGPVPGLGLEMGVRSGLGPGPGLGPGLGLGAGSGFWEIGPAPGFRSEIGIGSGPGLGPGLGLEPGPGLGARSGLGPGPGLGLELRPGPGLGARSGIGLGLGAGPGLGGICASTGAGQVPKMGQISGLDRIVSNKDCGFSMLCIAGDPGSPPPVIDPPSGVNTSLGGPAKGKSVLLADLCLGDFLPLTTSVILPLSSIPFVDFPLAWASAMEIAPPAANIDPHMIVATKSVLLL